MIKVGDLVMVVKPTTCCGYAGAIGSVHVVTGMHHAYVCRACDATVITPVALIDGQFEARELTRLKRIPPLEELERDQLVKELTV